MRAYRSSIVSRNFGGSLRCCSTKNSPAPVVSSTQRVAEATSPDYTAVYCSSFVQDEKIPADTLLVSGEESNVKVVFRPWRLCVHQQRIRTGHARW